jgi:hypothetical protein
VIRAKTLKSKLGSLFGPPANIVAVLLVTLLLAAGLPVKAQSRRVAELVDQLIFTPATPRPSSWTITVLPQARWDEQVKTLNLRTATAFTFMNETSNATFLNPDYVFNTRENQLLHTLAHEAGHLICRCTDERLANDIAEALEGHQ